MSRTVIGFFQDHSEAQRALDQLQQQGVGRDRIDLSKAAGSRSGSGSFESSSEVNPVSGSERDENSVRRTSDDRTVDPEGRNTNKFTDFFNNLFGGGNDNDDADRYRHVAERSGAMLTVHAASEEEAGRTADILDECGAVDVDESASQSGYAPRSARQGSFTGSSRTRSRIFDRQVDDEQRLRGSDDDPEFGSGSSAARGI